MGGRNGQKLKLLYIIEILKSETDEDHPLSATEICDKLAAWDVTAERKAIYDDIDKLIDFGFDIIKTRTPKSGFFLASREFEIPEIYLLTDAVRTAKFISPKKTRELVAKLDGMLSRYQAKKRNKAIFVDNTGKCTNEEIYYTIDTINEAIENRKKISLKYGIRALNDNREIVTVYNERVVSPYAMTWQDDHYYLICNNEKYNNLLHLRIDRMKTVEQTNDKIRPFSEVSDYTDVFDIADYTQKLFGMYSGDLKDVELKCSKKYIEQIADRFSENIFIRNVTDTHFNITVKAVESPALVTWIMNYGDGIEVLAPDSLKELIINRTKSILNLYDK